MYPYQLNIRFDDGFCLVYLYRLDEHEQMLEDYVKLSQNDQLEVEMDNQPLEIVW